MDQFRCDLGSRPFALLLVYPGPDRRNVIVFLGNAVSVFGSCGNIGGWRLGRDRRPQGLGSISDRNDTSNEITERLLRNVR